MAQSSGSGLSQLRDLLGRQEYQRRLQQLRKELIETQYQTRHQPYVTTPDPEAQVHSGSLHHGPSPRFS